MIKAVIFDWSGVLSDDWEATVATENEVLEHYGHRRLGEKEFRHLYELPWVNFYKKLWIEMDIVKEEKLWHEIFPKHAHLLKPLPKAKKTLLWLRKKGVKTIVFSSHSHDLVKKEVKEYGFVGLIDEVEGSNYDKREKIWALVERHEIERKSTLYVGDMCHDIETARMAGIRSVAVLGGYDSREKLEKEKPDFIIGGVGELPKLIEKLDGE